MLPTSLSDCFRVSCLSDTVMAPSCKVRDDGSSTWSVMLGDTLTWSSCWSSSRSCTLIWMCLTTLLKRVCSSWLPTGKSVSKNNTANQMRMTNSVSCQVRATRNASRLRLPVGNMHLQLCFPPTFCHFLIETPFNITILLLKVLWGEYSNHETYLQGKWEFACSELLRLKPWHPDQRPR